MPAAKVYLVTGATRGIGHGIITQLLARASKPTVIATVRNFYSAPAQKLAEQAKTTKQLVVLKLDSANGGEEDAKAAAKALQQQHNIDHVDVVIANAGMATDFDPIEKVTLDNLRTTMDVNLYAPITLFQAFEPLLSKSAQPQIVFISTAIASKGIQRALPYKSTTYGSAKAALNFVALRIAIEHPNIISLAVHPGLVKTDMGASAQRTLGLDIHSAEGSAVSVEESAKSVLDLSDKATLNDHSGKFYNAPEGTELPW